MEKLEKLFLEFMGEQEFTAADEMFARFSSISMDDMSNLLKWALNNAFIKQVEIDGDIYYTRTLAGRASLYPDTDTDLSDIPF